MEPVPRTTAPLHATGAVQFVPVETVSGDATFRLREVGDVAMLAGSIARLGQLSPVELRPLPTAGEGPVRWQVVAGFRRVAAARLLARGRVLARVHARLDDDDAWSLALTQALLGEPLAAAELEALRDRLSRTGAAPWAEPLLEEALVRAPVAPADRERFLAYLNGAPGPGPAGGEAVEVASGGSGEVDEVAAEPPPAEVAVTAAAPPVAVAPATGPEAVEVEVTAEELAADLAGRLWQVNQDLSLAVDAWDELPAQARRMILEQTRYMAELHPFLSRGGP